jgi:hypothetical protein
MRNMLLALAALASLAQAGCAGIWATYHSGAMSPVSTGADFVQVERGGELFTCGLKQGGAIVCWGGKNGGEFSSKSGAYRQFSVSAKHLCAVGLDGRISCWGSNKDGESTPPTGTFTQVAVGGRFDFRRPIGSFTTIRDECLYSCGLRSDGTVTCWGCGTCGQTAAPPGRFQQIAARWHNACGVRDNGSVECWGLNSPGVFDSVPPGEFVKVNVGLFHACAIRKDGTIACWGTRLRRSVDECSQETGEKLANLRRELDQIKREQGVEKLSQKALQEAEARHAAAVAFIYSLNEGTYGQPRIDPGNIGFAMLAGLQSLAPAALRAYEAEVVENYKKIYAGVPQGTFVDVAGDYSFNCAISINGTVTCWSLAAERPDLYAPSPGTFRSLSYSAGMSGCMCGVRTDGRISCWGADRLGECLDAAHAQPEAGALP